MEHESFENKEVAKVLNKDFISIKVDREERPDVDKIYMDAVQAMTGSGGWPLTAILTPDRKIIFGGTYFPKQKFLALLTKIQSSWKTQKKQILSQVDYLYQQLKEIRLDPGSSEIDNAGITQFNRQVKISFDTEYGGFGNAPKFPPTMRLKMIMRTLNRTKNKKLKIELTAILNKTLLSMFKGGIYDHIGGGFHRYSTDKKWLAPHFEKMLYDQGRMAITYFEAFLMTKNKIYLDIGEDILRYVLRDMSSPEGGFFSAEDADSEGEEGLFYLWDKKEILKVLGKKEGTQFANTYDVTLKNNFEHSNILNLIHRDESHSFTQKTMIQKKKLFDIREKRIHPIKDDKVITGWNGLMIRAMALAYKITKKKKYLAAATKSASFLKAKLFKKGKLLRRYREGEAKFNATLDDYAYLIEGLLELYQVSGKNEWLRWSIDLQNKQDEIFWDSKLLAYNFAEKADDLILRSISFYDGARPNSNGVSLINLQKLYALTFKSSLKTKYITLLSRTMKTVNSHPTGYTTMVMGQDYFLDYSKEIVVIKGKNKKEFERMLDLVYVTYLPNAVVIPLKAKQDYPVLAKDKAAIGGKSTAFVCHSNICLAPSFNVKELKKQLLPKSK